MFTKKWLTKRRVAAIVKVIEEIDKYKGEPFQPGEHPLHDAVVNLEETLSNSVRRYCMFRPALAYWKHGLAACRSGMPRKAVMEMKKLRAELRVWLEREPWHWRYRVESLREEEMRSQRS